jgi:hypothetical protein
MLIAALVAVACAGCSEAAPKLDSRAQAMVERSQKTSATYSLMAWNDVPEGGEIQDGWSAEFHRGRLHRVETPRDRIIADCDTMTGTWYSLKTGERITGSQVAKAACGINTNYPFRSTEWLGRTKTPYGEADRVRLTDDHSIRVYEVLDNGALATSLFEYPDGKPMVDNRATEVLSSAPDDIFTEASLDRGVAAEIFQPLPTGFLK